MGREYIIQTWVKHDANDPRVIPDELLDHSTGYSGQQVGNRLAKSNGNVKTWKEQQGFLRNGQADINGAFDEEEAAKDELLARKANPLLSVDPAFKTLLDYEHKVKALQDAFDRGQIDRLSFESALRVLDVKADKAERKLAALKAHILLEEENDEPEENSYLLLVEHTVPPYQPTLKERAIAVSEWASYEGTK